MSRNFTPDQTLIDHLLLDDTTALEELHHRYCYSLYNYSLKKLGSADDARQIVRDIFICLWEKRHTLPVDFSISLYLYTEVRKAVVRSVNEGLNNNKNISAVENKIIPGFDIMQLQKARIPVKNPGENKIPGTFSTILLQNKKTRGYNRNQYSLVIMNLNKIRFAFHKMLNLL